MADECANCGDLFTDGSPSCQSSVDPDLCEWCYTQGPDVLPDCYQCGEAVIPGHACAEAEV